MTTVSEICEVAYDVSGVVVLPVWQPFRLAYLPTFMQVVLYY